MGKDERETLRIPLSPFPPFLRASAGLHLAAASAGRLGSRHKAGTSTTRTFPSVSMAVFLKEHWLQSPAWKIPEISSGGPPVQCSCVFVAVAGTDRRDAHA